MRGALAAYFCAVIAAPFCHGFLIPPGAGSPGILKLYSSSTNDSPPQRDLSGKEKRALRALACRPDAQVITLRMGGQSPGFLHEVREQLDAHELIKVKLSSGEEKKERCRQIATETDSMLVQVLGHTCLLYRENSSAKKIDLQKLTSDK